MKKDPIQSAMTRCLDSDSSLATCKTWLIQHPTRSGKCQDFLRFHKMPFCLILGLLCLKQAESIGLNGPMAQILASNYGPWAKRSRNWAFHWTTWIEDMVWVGVIIISHQPDRNNLEVVWGRGGSHPSTHSLAYRLWVAGEEAREVEELVEVTLCRERDYHHSNRCMCFHCS